MYAEGDSDSAGTQQAQYLKETLVHIVDSLKDQGDIYLPLCYFVFAEQIARYFKTKSLTKNIREDGDEFDEVVDNDQFETIDDIIGQPAQDSKILEELEDDD